jgi:hypothetical protein
MPAHHPPASYANRWVAHRNRHDNIERILEMTQKYCGKCGNPVQPKDLFCVKCGSPLGSKNIVADHNESPTPEQKQSLKSIPPMSPEQPQETPVANTNPFTTDVAIKSGTLLFKCPTCPNTISVTLQQIDPIVGISVLCSSCKNISHIPGIYKTDPKPAGMRITGGIRVPIAEFSDWYYKHPLITSLVEKGQSDLLNDYGVWAFCSACYHQYPSTILTSLAISQSMAQRGAGGFMLMANTPDSKKDMNALGAGHCSHCNQTFLIVIATEIPDYVRSVIKSKMK